MTVKQVTNVAASVRQRLKNVADETGRPFAEVLQWYAIERFLTRFASTPHASQYIVKGAAVLRTLMVEPARPTMDIDLMCARVLSVAEVVAMVRDCLIAESDPDGLEFDEASLDGREIRVARPYPGVRVRFRGKLDTARVTLQVDVGFGDVMVPAPRRVVYPSLLGRTGPSVIAYRPESVIAEKLEAMISLGIRNSRMKDYFDVWWLATVTDFDGEMMCKAVASTLARRKTSIPSGTPPALTEKVVDSVEKRAQWRAFLRRMNLPAQGPDLSEAVRLISEFLLPVLRAISENSTIRGRWVSGRGWVPHSDA